MLKQSGRFWDLESIQGRFLQFSFVDDNQLEKISLLLQTKLSVISALSVLSEDGRKKFLEEIEPVVSHLNTLLSISDRQKEAQKEKEKAVAEEVKNEALKQVIMSGKGVGTDIGSIIRSLNEALTKEKERLRNTN